MADFESSFFPLDANQATIEQLQGLLAAEYDNYITSTDCNVGYMYRYIFNTIKFVTDDPYNKKDIKSRDRYLNLLQAQLSNEELCLIFYNAISKYGKNKEGQYYFKELLDATHFLENIDSSFLLDRKHYKLYIQIFEQKRNSMCNTFCLENIYRYLGLLVKTGAETPQK